jgi:hypothetical protein
MGDIVPLPRPLPSIVDLARHASAALLLAGRPRQSPKSPGDIEERVARLYERDEALRLVLLTFRPKTLSDAVAQLFAGFIMAEDLAALALPPEEHYRRAIALRQIFLGTIPVVAKAASLDLAEIGGEYIPDFAAREFPAEG